MHRPCLRRGSGFTGTVSSALALLIEISEWVPDKFKPFPSERSRRDWERAAAAGSLWESQGGARWCCWLSSVGPTAALTSPPGSRGSFGAEGAREPPGSRGLARSYLWGRLSCGLREAARRCSQDPPACPRRQLPSSGCKRDRRGPAQGSLCPGGSQGGLEGNGCQVGPSRVEGRGGGRSFILPALNVLLGAGNQLLPPLTWMRSKPRPTALL